MFKKTKELKAKTTLSQRHGTVTGYPEGLHGNCHALWG